MTSGTDSRVPVAMTNAFTNAQTVTAGFDTGDRRGGVRLSVTPAGLLAVGGLVAAILLSVPPIVRAVARARRGGD